MRPQIINIKTALSGNGANSFVGLSINEKRELTISFPIEYRLSKKGPLTVDQVDFNEVNSLFTLILDAQRKDLLPLDEDTANLSFPIFDYMYVIEYFIQHNYEYYKETETLYGQRDSGKISWSKTIKNTKPTLIGDNVFYLDPIRRYSSLDDDNLITELNKYCVYVSTELIGPLYGITGVEESSFIDEDYSEYYISFLYSKISQTNNDNNKRLFRSMIAILEDKSQKIDEDSKEFGTYEFHYIWEHMVDEVFGSASSAQKKKFYPYFTWKYIDTGQIKETKYLMPDTIYIDEKEKKVYVIDAKYYASSLPDSSDINKQFAYIEYAKSVAYKNYSVNHISPFIIPYDKKSSGSNIFWNAETSNEKTGSKVYAVYVDTKDLVDTYLGNSSDTKVKKCFLLDLIDDKSISQDILSN